VPKPKERKALVKNIHEEIGHFNEGRTLAKVKKRLDISMKEGHWLRLRRDCSGMTE
jgi:hypothetical protein